jgi:hypothetical protein
VRIRPGDKFGVGLRIKDQFTGNFTVRALDPATQTVITQVALQTAISKPIRSTRS